MRKFPSLAIFRCQLLRHLRPIAWLVASAVLWTAGSAHAEALDEAHLVGSGEDAVLQIRFNVRVQYQRHAPLAESDLIEVYFQLVGGDEALTRPIEETLRVASQDPAPGATITYPVQTGLPVKKIVIQLDHKARFRVRAGLGSQLLEIVLPGLAPKGAVPRAVSAIVERDRYAISLQAMPMSDQSSVRAIPSRLQNYDVFGSQVMRNGTPYYELLLGYFESQAAAEAALAQVRADFPDAQVIDVVARKEANLQNAAQLAPAPAAPAPAAAPMPAAAPELGPTPAPLGAGAPILIPAPVPAPAPGPLALAPPSEPEGASAAAAAAAAIAAAPETDMDRQGAALMATARAALVAGKNDEAINTLNQLLLLPPNKYSQDAQELVGLARERSGDLVQARKEYELYLRLFPSGVGATRVRQRLASMAPPEIAPTEAARPPQVAEPRMSAGGSIAQYYYGGKQRTQTTQTLVAGGLSNPSVPQISSNVQSSLATTVDLNGRYRTESSDTRIVFRDSDQYSFIQAVSPSINRLDAAYVDYRDLKDGIGLKVGRQAGVTGGLVGRFDGATLSVDLAPKLRVNAVVGVPVAQDEFVQASQRFEGLSLEAQNFAEHWGASAFVINQTADSVVDRRAVGADLRYFDSHRTLYALVDYDVQFAALNAATLQGTYQLEDQTTMSLLLDDRKAPTLTTSNGLLQWGCSSYVEYFAGNCQKTTGATPTVELLRQAAEATTANSHQLALDVAHPLGQSWQVSLDARLSSVGALPTVVIANQTFQGSSATGNVFGLTAQATGSNLYSKRDINVFSATHLRSESLSGTQLSYNNLNGLLDNRLTLAPGLALYWENDVTGQKIVRLSPGLHTGYKLTPRMSVEATFSMERSRNEGPTQNDTTTNVFYYLGYRYDLN